MEGKLSRQTRLFLMLLFGAASWAPVSALVWLGKHSATVDLVASNAY